MSWFLLKDRRHEGPFTRDDLLNRVLQGELKLESYLIRAEDLERGVINYVRVSSVVGALLPTETGGGPTGEARRETRDPDSIDAFVPQDAEEPLPIERIASLAPKALDLEPVDLVGRGARTQELRIHESQTASRPRPADLLQPDEPSWIESLLSGRALGRFAGALVFLWIVSLGIEQWKRPGAERQVAAVNAQRGVKAARPARAASAREDRVGRPRLMPTERPSAEQLAPAAQGQLDAPDVAPSMGGRALRKRGLAAPRDPEVITEPTDGSSPEDPVIGEGGAEPVDGDEREPGSVDDEANEDAQIDAEPVEVEEAVEDDGEGEILPEEN